MKYFTTLLFLLLFLNSFGQNPDEWKRYGDEAWDEKDFYGAAHYYAKGLAQDSEYLEIHWKMAESYRRYNDYRKALTAYESLFKKDEKEQFPKALFYYALMLKHNERYLEAQNYFDKYADVYKYEDPYLTKKAQQEIESCLWAAEHQKDSVNTEAALLPQHINSTDSELNPWLTADSVLHFASLRFTNAEGMKLSKGDGKRAIFVRNYRARSMKEGSDQKELHIDVPDELNFEGKHMAGYYADENLGMAFLTACNPLCDIYWSQKSDAGEWLPFEPLEAVNQSGYTTTQPHVVKIEDKITLFFSSDRARGKGNMDIWYAEYRRDKFMRPRNLRDVNTKGNEVTPWYDTTEQALYLSSDWHFGYGGYDVFKSDGTPPKLKAPENLIKPVNSAANDLYYKPSRVYNRAYFVSNREGGFALKGESCCNNIYAVEIDSLPPKPLIAEVPDTTTVEKDTVVQVVEPPEKDEPVEVKTTPPVIVLDFPEAAFYFPNDAPDARTYSTTTSQSYFDVLKKYRSVADEYAAQNETFQSAFFDEKVSGSDQLLQNLTAELEKAVDGGNSVYVFLRGYSSTLAASNYNTNLSKRRIKSIENALLKSAVLAEASQLNQLTFLSSPYGEHEARMQNISGDRNALKASVYSVEAAKSRKVAVSKILIRKTGKPAGIPAVINPVQKLKSGNVEVSFEIKNAGDTALILKDREIPDGLALKDREVIVNPGIKRKVTFTARDLKPGVYKITLNANGIMEVDLYVIYEEH